MTTKYKIEKPVVLSEREVPEEKSVFAIVCCPLCEGANFTVSNYRDAIIECHECGNKGLLETKQGKMLYSRILD